MSSEVKWNLKLESPTKYNSHIDLKRDNLTTDEPKNIHSSILPVAHADRIYTGLVVPAVSDNP